MHCNDLLWLRCLRVIPATLWLASCASAQAPAPLAMQRTIVHRADVPDSNYEVIVIRGDAPAGSVTGKHTHPGTVVGYVLEGEYSLVVEGQPTQRLKAGQTLTIPAGLVHEERAESGEAKFLAVFTVEKGKPLTTPVAP